MVHMSHGACVRSEDNLQEESVPGIKLNTVRLGSRSLFPDEPAHCPNSVL